MFRHFVDFPKAAFYAKDLIGDLVDQAIEFITAESAKAPM